MHIIMANIKHLLNIQKQVFALLNSNICFIYHYNTFQVYINTSRVFLQHVIIKKNYFYLRILIFILIK